MVYFFGPRINAVSSWHFFRSCTRRLYLCKPPFQVAKRSSRIESMSSLATNPSYLRGLPKYFSFLDEAGPAKAPGQHYLCLAGLLALEVAWKKFNDDWQDACLAE